MTHRGDVIVWRPDGWPWSERERSNADWRIIWVDLTNTEADALINPELDQLGVKAFTWKRGRKLDLDAGSVPAALRTHLNDDKRADAVFDARGSAGLFGAITERKPNAAEQRA